MTSRDNDSNTTYLLEQGDVTTQVYALYWVSHELKHLLNTFILDFHYCILVYPICKKRFISCKSTAMVAACVHPGSPSPKIRMDSLQI